MPRFDLFSIGHSNIAEQQFLALLRGAGVTSIADVRSVPHSRFYPWFSQKQLSASLAAADIGYAAMGDTLGGRPRDDGLYRDGVADYEAMAARPEYAAGLGRLLDAVARSQVCVLCAEREPLDCHRCLLVARSVGERGLTVGHILHDGSIEPHAETEQRLLALRGYGDDRDLFASGQHERLAAAYRRRGHAVAFRRKATTRSSAEAQ
ncbi:MAG: DUF488 domain-containing protein [Xanthobacteraceae bacterium]|jgi:uncharacterized protein (DUF488 family)